MGGVTLDKDREEKLEQRKRKRRQSPHSRKRKNTPTMREIRLLLVRGLYDAIEVAAKETKSIEAFGVDPELAKAFAGNTRAFIVFLIGIGIEVMGAQIRGELQEKESLVKPARVGDLKALEKYGLKKWGLNDT